MQEVLCKGKKHFNIICIVTSSILGHVNSNIHDREVQLFFQFMKLTQYCNGVSSRIVSSGGKRVKKHIAKI